MPRPPRNIVVCCDGTGNKYGLENSNVVKLYTCIDVNAEQSAYYHPGVGTMGDPRKTTWLSKKLSVVGGLAFGAGFMENLADAYCFLMQEYGEGDHIYLFGFSRGAYTVRALAGAIYMYGLLCPGNSGHLLYMLDMFSKESRKAYSRDYAGKVKKYEETAESRGFRDTFSRVVPIHFLGVWDTVSSLGFHDPVRLLFDGQNPIVNRARHAISVDERRCFFQANLLGDPLPGTKTPVLAKNYPNDPSGYIQNVVQAWFPGVHSDVGGSYPQHESDPAMQALRWMLDEASTAGILVNEGKRKAIFGENPSPYPDLEKMNPQPHPGSKIHNSLTWNWWPLEVIPHQYFDQFGVKRWRLTPWPHSREIPEGALLHPSLRHRLATHPGYKPKNLNPKLVHDFDALPNAIPQADLTQQLRKEKYGVYRPEATARPSTVKATSGIAATFILGLATWLLRR